MNVEETTSLCKIIRSIVPAQKFEPETPALWAGVLRDIRAEDAREAVRRVPRREGFIDPSDIVAEVRVIRQERLDAVGADTITPTVDPDDPRAYAAELRALRTAIADGELLAHDLDAYRAGKFTLTGAPARPALTAADVEVSRPRALEAAARAAFPRMPATRPEDYAPATGPVVSPTVGSARSAVMEAERARQLAALVTSFGPGVADGAPPPPGPDGVS